MLCGSPARHSDGNNDPLPSGGAGEATRAGCLANGEHQLVVGNSGSDVGIRPV